jgi:hypothetical protein
MYEIDLHGMTVVEAISYLETKCNSMSITEECQIKVIHGYGASGNGGKIKNAVLKFVEKHKDILRHISGEKVEQNPGYTILYLKKKLNITDIGPGNEIIEYLSVPRTIEKISGEFRKYGMPKIMDSLKKLENKGIIETEYKNGIKKYTLKK